MPQVDYFAMMEGWGLMGGWPGITREEMHALLRPQRPPSLEEISRLQPEEVAQRLLQDAFETLKLTHHESTKLAELKESVDFRWLSDDDIKWLAQLILRHNGPSYLFGLLARFWQDRAIYKMDPWCLARAASCWRDSGYPHMAVECLKDQDSSTDKRLASAFRTSRAGALLDLSDLERAESEAREAISLSDKEPHAFNVLGAIFYRKGDFGTGDLYFSQAEDRGGDGAPKKKDVLEILESMAPVDRQAFAKSVLQKYPKKHSWVRRYVH